MVSHRPQNRELNNSSWLPQTGGMMPDQGAQQPRLQDRELNNSSRLPQTGGIMPDQKAQQAHGFLEPPAGTAFYNVPPLAGRKRQRDEDDSDVTSLAGRKRQRDEDDIGGDKVRQQFPAWRYFHTNSSGQYATTNQTDSAVNTTQTEHINQEDNLRNVSGIANSVATHQDTSAIEETRKCLSISCYHSPC
ncbi:hypothetical protein GJ744_000113 [Endocarpon pusillum]|uniref:Uncharacterized protein n=1 Tax=Endocarpon pusillum TaxID=364733 RepID=A0A8H7AS42_9EURO|nr:hypothetical protein GJ744_000113 [Endocarpon pusillum]